MIPAGDLNGIIMWKVVGTAASHSYLFFLILVGATVPVSLNCHSNASAVLSAASQPLPRFNI